MIVGNNICLRAIEPGDLDTLYAWENDMSLWVVSNTITPFSRFQLKKYIEHASLDIFQTRQLRLMIDYKTENNSYSPAGLIDLYQFDAFHQRAGIGILVHKPLRQKGIAGEALTCFIPYCFQQLGLHQLYCSVMTNNKASTQLFESKGFKLSGIRKEWRKTPAGFVDEAFYQLLNLTEGRD